MDTLIVIPNDRLLDGESQMFRQTRLAERCCMGFVLHSSSSLHWQHICQQDPSMLMLKLAH